ncbi:MAG: M23 family metallopeptidase [Rikenellaceae bacterium]
MSTKDKYKIEWRDIFRRHRLSLRNTKNNREVWYTHISPSKILSSFMMFTLIVLSLVITVVSYSPILEYIPGYRSDALRSREEFINSIIRLDSLERVIDDMMLYSQNVALIMDGKLVKIDRDIEIKGNREGSDLVQPNRADSILRREMEGEGRYNIRMAEVLAGLPINKPIEGIVTKRFDIASEHFGVEITSAAGEKILALQDGIVQFAGWLPEGGYMVTILHPDNMVSLYSGLSQIIVKRGEAIRGGMVIGYNSEEIVDKSGKREIVSSPIVFELWSGGNPVDPERFITF